MGIFPRLESAESKGRRYYTECRYSEAEGILRHLVKDREKTIGAGNIKTINDKRFLGLSLYKQGKHEEAELIFQEVLRLREQVLGADHTDTLSILETLAKALYDQGKYAESEPYFRQLADRNERNLGKDDARALWHQNFLGYVLALQEKWSEAEECFNKAAIGRALTLGNSDSSTLSSKTNLATMICEQERYSAAEPMLRGILQEGRKKKKDTVMLYARYWLGRCVLAQENYTEAAQNFYKAYKGTKKTLGENDFSTLASGHYLAKALLHLQKYEKARSILTEITPILRTGSFLIHHEEKQVQAFLKEDEIVLQETHLISSLLPHQLPQEIIAPASPITLGELLGQEHPGVIDRELAPQISVISLLPDDPSLLEKTLEGPPALEPSDVHVANREREEMSQNTERSMLDPEGDSPERRIMSLHTVEEKPVAEQSLNSDSTSDAVSSAAVGGLGHFFEDRSGTRAKYNDSEIIQIALILKQTCPRWSRVPRTYIVLRSIEHLDLLDKFIDMGFSDYWFPVTEKSVPACLHPSYRRDFVNAQEAVLTKSIGLEKGGEGRHCQFRRDEPLPFEEKGILGSGGYGQVDKVMSLVSFKEYARKRVRRRQVFDSQRTKAMNEFITEIEICKRLKHRHIIQMLGSYTDWRYIGLIMLPIADMDLSTYLAQADTSIHGELRTFFGCLARGLEFLHGQNVRHKDIKPSNILVHGGNVLFTDFGLSLDYTDAAGSTTASIINGLTPRYCAPEVAAFEPRNTASDVWSLGVVFLEMATVLKGKSVDFLHEFFEQHGTQQSYVRTNFTALPELMTVLRSSGRSSDNLALEWPQQMLQVEQSLRPTASNLILSITGLGQTTKGASNFCGICCVTIDDFSDSSSDESE